MKTFFILLGKIILKFLITLGLFYLGWNLCLVNIFPNIQVLNFGQLCLLVCAKSLLFADVDVNMDKK
jgi:hypothetical protein